MPGRGRDPFRMSAVFGSPSRMSGNGREDLPDVQEWSRCPPGCLEVVRRPARMTGSGREDIPDVQEWSVVVTTFGTTLQNIQEW